jgi:hypothetical protein
MHPVVAPHEDVGSDQGMGLDDATIAQAAGSLDHGIGSHRDPIAQLYVRPYDRSGMNHALRKK